MESKRTRANPQRTAEQSLHLKEPKTENARQDRWYSIVGKVEGVELGPAREQMMEGPTKGPTEMLSWGGNWEKIAVRRKGRCLCLDKNKGENSEKNKERSTALPMA